MDAAAFEQVYGSFRDFHAYFAPLFGRRETREHSGHYLQALLVQSGERRNAENLSETVPGSARGMQRFLADSPWDDEVIIGRLQEYLNQYQGEIRIWRKSSAAPDHPPGTGGRASPVASEPIFIAPQM